MSKVSLTNPDLWNTNIIGIGNKDITIKIMQQKCTSKGSLISEIGVTVSQK